MRLFWTLVTASTFVTSLGFAAVGAPAGDAGADPDADKPKTCIERIPEGKTRPKLVEKFPSRGKSGYVAELTVELEHGKGESVLSGDATRASDDLALLKRASFILPDPAGGAKRILVTEPSGNQQKSVLTIPVVPLPEKPGRHELLLPPLPLAISRASGEVLTLCTEPHRITIEDPIANDPHPKPHANPPARRQAEEWKLMKQVAIAAALALVVGALLAWLIGRWLRRERPVPPPPPPRPPWEVAMEELFDIKNARLIESARFAEHFDRVSDAVRKYLGALYGFDGLESTTREIISMLRRLEPQPPISREIETFLKDADLVKFARLTPSVEECESALGQAERIVQETMPSPEQVASRIPNPPSEPEAPGASP